MSEAAHPHKDPTGDRFGMWLFLFTELLLFGGLFLLYAVYLTRYPEAFVRGGEELNLVFGTVNTLILLTSSLAVAMAVTALQRGNIRLTLWLLAATIASALIFLVNKYFEWSAKIHHGLYPNSPELLGRSAGENLFFGLYYLTTGLHGLHVLLGGAILSWVLVLVRKGKVTPENHVTLENAGLYWHLVDLIWIFVFPLYYLIL
jgi:cytochrome c oxidase subunit III